MDRLRITVLGAALGLVSLSGLVGAQTYTRTDVIVYHDNASKWVLGQVASSTNTNTGLVEYATTYDATTALPLQTYAFGKLQQTLTYNANGNVATVKDGNNNVTTLSNWKRGIPQTIQHPATPEATAGAIQSAVVDNNGWITSVTDENGFTTNYTYDPMGRLASIVYPIGDSPASLTTTQVFQPVAGVECGIPAGHWRQTISTGNARKITYFDALWRPLVVREYDTAAEATTQRFLRFTYDHDGRVTFASYPSTVNNPATGSWSTYDALGRRTLAKQDWEGAGQLETKTEYLSGFLTRVTNPRGHKTLTKYMAWDQPTYDYPIIIDSASGAAEVSSVDITRDVFGKPTALRKRDRLATIALTRSYTYNANQELCRADEPETGSSFMGYDAAGNLAWSVAGYITPTAGCQSAAAVAARRADRTYDARNRLATLSFPDGLGNTVSTYTPDGLLASITADNGGSSQVTTNYTYNRRRLLIGERMLWGSIDWPIQYAYDANGHMASKSSYGGFLVTYAPNALGQPTQAGTYATGVKYFPNGAMKEFTYGNGILHTLSQNARGLPDTSCDYVSSCNASSVLNDGYDYDQNGNVAAITDGRTGNRGNRTMTYDGLDRLTGTTSPMFGTAVYAYDALDNLTRVKVGTTSNLAARDHYYCYDGSWRLTNVKTGSCAGASVVGLGYDLQGNLANKNGAVYNFDYGNRLRGVNGIASYVYDGHGRRARDYTTASKYSQYGMDGRLTFVSDGRAANRSWYIDLNGSLVAIRERDTATGTVTTKYQHTDALGSPVAVTNTSKTVIERSEYEPYGRVGNRAARDGVGYTGHVEDAATSLTYMQQRYYDPQIGLFLSVDPVTAYSNPVGQFHRYRYANNNPYKFTDPDGRIADIVLDIGFAAYSAYVLAKDPSWTNLAALGADIGAAAVPGVTGAGVAVRAGGSAADAVRAVNGVTDATRTARPADGAAMGTDEALDTASSYLGDGYKQIADGVFRSADGTRQVRMTNSDLATSKNHAGAPHMNFEEGVTTTKPSGRQVFDAEHNSHVYLSDENRR